MSFETPSDDNNDLLVECLDLAHGGTMVCQVKEGPAELIGKKAFVRGLAPGESALVEISANKRSFIEAQLTQIKTPSPSRIGPPCPVFDECGGCDLQYLPIDQQRELKRRMVESMLKRQSGLVLPGDVELLGAALPAFAYRKRISLHINEAGELGFYRQGSGDVVAISECMIASPPINQTLRQLNEIGQEIANHVAGVVIEEFLDYGVPVFQLRDDIYGKTLTALQDRLKGSFSFGKIYFRNRKRFEWHEDLSKAKQNEFSTLNHFSQINDEGNQILIDTVLRHLEGEQEITEFYAGSGNFSFPLARAGKRVDAIEVDEQLTKRGREQATIEGLSQLVFQTSSVERFFANSRSHVHRCVLLDPPRSGAKVVAEKLSPGQVKTIVYVSCALPTLARDLVTLVGRGFVIERVSVLDMFPQTHHVESIVLLRG